MVDDILLRLEGQPRAFRLEVDLLKRQLYDRLRGLEILIRKLRQFHSRRHDGAGVPNPFAENWCPSFSVVEEGATVHPSAEIHDSVVLRGARVESNAIVVRSLVGPGQVVRRGQRLVDRFVNGTRQGRA